MCSFEIGSITAKGGFANERAICQKFNNWRTDPEAQTWLRIMGYKLEWIDTLEAVQIPTRMKREVVERLGLSEPYEDLMRFKKADAQVRLVIKMGSITRVENLSLKKANADSDYNQVDKR